MQDFVLKVEIHGIPHPVPVIFLRIFWEGDDFAVFKYYCVHGMVQLVITQYSYSMGQVVFILQQVNTKQGVRVRESMKYILKC